MIKVTREFATVEEAVAFLQGGEKLPPFIAPRPAAATAAPAPATPSAPAGGSAPLPGAPVTPPAPPLPAAPVAAANGGFTQAQVAAQAQAYSKAYKPAATKAVFAHFGITKISEAKPEIYPQLMAALTVQAA